MIIKLAGPARALIHMTLAVSLLLLPSAGFSADSDNSQPKPQPAAPVAAAPTINTDELFHQLVQDPFVSKAYHATLGLSLRTFSDLTMAQNFTLDPIFQRAGLKLKAAEEEGVRSSVLNGQANQHRITKATYPRIYKLLVQIARNDGYTDEQISKMDAFVIDDLNAAMFSPFVDHIGIYIGKPLINSMSDEAIKAIIGHEFGHNIFKHVELRFQMMAMMNILGGVFAKAAGFTEMDFSQLANFDPNDRGNMSPELHAFWKGAIKSLFKNIGVASDGDFKNPVIKARLKMFAEYMTEVNNQFKGSFQARRKEAINSIAGMASGNPKVGAASVMNFLDSLIVSLQMMPVPETTVQYFRHLQGTFQDAMQANRPPFQMGTAEFVEKAVLAMANVSQAMEMSADAAGLIQTEWKYMAEGFLVFTDAELDPLKAGFDGKNAPAVSAEELRDMIIKERQLEWSRFITEQSPSELRDSLGGDPREDHPVPLMRLTTFFLRSQMTPTLIFQNPFTRFLALYQGLLAMQSEVDTAIRQMNEGFAQSKQKMMALDPQLARQQEAILKIKIETLQETKQKAAQNTEKISGLILKLVADPGLPSLDKNNPRLMDLIDFQLAQRQDALEIFNGMKKLKFNPDQLKIAEGVAQNVSLYDTPLMKNLILTLKKAGAANDRRIAQIQTLVTPSSSLETVKTARTELAAEGRYALKNTHRPIDTKLPDDAVLILSGNRLSCVNIIPRLTD